MNKESWIHNLNFALLEIKLWKKNLAKQLRKQHPNISKEELNKKIKRKKTKRFGNKFSYLLTEHPKRTDR